MIHCRGGGSPPVLTFAFSIFISPCLCASVFNKKRITLIFCNPFLIRACLNFAQVNFANCFRGCFSDFMRRIAGYLTNKIGKTDRKQTKKNLIEYYFIGKFKRQALRRKLKNISDASSENT